MIEKSLRMGTPNSKTNRIKEEEKQNKLKKNPPPQPQQQNPAGLSNLPGTPAPPKFPVNNNQPIYNQPPININNLPRENDPSGEIVAAIDDVNKKLNDRSYLEVDSGVSSANSDPDIEYLLQEVRRRAKKQEELDQRLIQNEKKISQLYSRLSQTSMENRDHSNSNRRSKLNDSNRYQLEDNNDDDYEKIYSRISSNNKSANAAKKKKLLKELNELKEIERDKKLKLLEQDRKIAQQNMKLTDKILEPRKKYNNDDNDYNSDYSDYKSSRRKNCDDHQHERRHRNNSYKNKSKSTNQMIRVSPIDSGSDEIRSHDNYDSDYHPRAKPRHSKRVPIKNNQLIKIETVCPKDRKNSDDISEHELKKVISIIKEEEEKIPKSTRKSRYYLNGKEIYVSESNKKTNYGSDDSSRKRPIFVKIEQCKDSESESEKNKKIVNQTFDDFKGNYLIEKTIKVEKPKEYIEEPQATHYNKYSFNPNPSNTSMNNKKIARVKSTAERKEKIIPVEVINTYPSQNENVGTVRPRKEITTTEENRKSVKTIEWEANRNDLTPTLTTLLANLDEKFNLEMA